MILFTALHYKMDYPTIIETFFSMIGRFDFDRAKSYIDGRKEILQKLSPTFPNQVQLMAMLSTLSHLAEVEKIYHNQPFVNQPQHSFLPSTNFLRKAKSLKDMFNDIYFELQHLENMESATVNPLAALRRTPEPTPSLSHVDQPTAVNHQPTQSPVQQKRLATSNKSDMTTYDQHSSTSSSTEKDSPVAQVPQSPGTAFRNSFFRVLSPMSSSNSVAQLAHSSPIDPYSLSSGSGYEPPPNSTTTTPIAQSVKMRDFSEELISHFCRQLQSFIQARLDMIDVYEKLSEASSKKYSSVDGIAFRLSMLCRQYHKDFHHPLLAPIKEGINLECESLMTLIRATIDMQHWRFLPTLFDLQEAQSKLNYWAASTFNKEASKRRFKVTRTQAPRLYEWLCKFREFLVAKFTLYFHATLSKNFPIVSFKNCCSKLNLDYYSRLSSFQRKIDALFVALIYDVSNEKDFRGLGYNFPSRDYHQPQGKNTLQPMVVIPAEGRTKLDSLQAEIYMIVMTNQQAMMKDGQYLFHDNIKRYTYSLTKPDSNVVLVIVCEGLRPDRDAHLRSFSLEISNQFAFLNIFAN